MPTQETRGPPILLKYQQTFEANKRSRVFAPLAEGYRKLGLIDKALEICREGLRHNPGYVLGHYTLAQCYYDIGQKQFAFDTIRPFVAVNRDNFSLQKFYALMAMQLNEKEEALITYKYLLFANPKDKDAQEKIKILQEDSEIDSVVIDNTKKKNSNPHFEIDKLSNTNDPTLDDWVTLEFNQHNFSKTLEAKKQKTENMTDVLNWEEVKINQYHSQETVKNDTEEGSKLDFKREESAENVEIEFQIENQELNQIDNQEPIVTHTLVDLYLSQGLNGKAFNILKKINELHPDDQKTLMRIQELESSDKNEIDDQEGKNELMNLVEKVRSSKNIQRKILLEKFLISVKNHSIAKQRQ